MRCIPLIKGTEDFKIVTVWGESVATTQSLPAAGVRQQPSQEAGVWPRHLQGRPDQGGPGTQARQMFKMSITKPAQSCPELLLN